MAIDSRFVDPPQHRRPVSFSEQGVFFPWGVTLVGSATTFAIIFAPLAMAVLWLVSNFVAFPYALVIATTSGIVVCAFIMMSIDRHRINVSDDGIALLLSMREGETLLWEGEQCARARVRFARDFFDHNEVCTLEVWDALIAKEHRVRIRQDQIIETGIINGDLERIR